MTLTDTPENNKNLEKQLLNEISAIDARIAELGQERAALERLLTKARRQNVELRDVTRRNSVGRILIEKKIIETLQGSRNGLHASLLFNDTKVDYPALKPVTFRSYLHRLKEREEIKPVPGRRGVWEIAKKQS